MLTIYLAMAGFHRPVSLCWQVVILLPATKKLFIHFVGCFLYKKRAQDLTLPVT